MNAHIAKNIVYRNLQRLRREPILDCLRELEQSQWLSNEEAMEMQWSKVVDTLKTAYNNVPFYRRRFDEAGIALKDIQTPDDFLKVPFIAKAEIKERFEDLISTSCNKPLSLVSTSGSSGDPISVYKERASSAYNRAAMYRSYGWYGIDIGDKQGRLWGGGITFGTTMRKKAKDLLMNRKRLSAFDLSEEKMRSFYQKLLRFRPKYLYGYASVLFTFARFLNESHLKPEELALTAVVSTAEPLHPFQRELVGTVFRCPVFNEYGCSEIGMLAYECSRGSMHIVTENVYLEFIDNGKPVAPGEPGEIIVTELNNPSMPLIRYRLGDIGRPAKNLCDCGRGLPTMEVIDGKALDLVRASDGRLLHGHMFDYIIKHTGSVKKFKVIQRSMQEIALKIVKAKNFDNRFPEAATRKIRELLGDDINVTIEYVDEIAPERSGKLRYFVSEIDAEQPMTKDED